MVRTEHLSFSILNLTVVDSDAICYTAFVLMTTRQQPGDETEYSLGELAERSGLPERTIRYYIARGVLAEPARRGRGAYYTGEHLQRLKSIMQSQKQGLTLTEIERQSSKVEHDGLLAEPEPWLSYAVSPDVVVQVRSGLSPWRTRQVRSALARLAHELRAETDSDNVTNRKDS